MMAKGRLANTLAAVLLALLLLLHECVDGAPVVQHRSMWSAQPENPVTLRSSAAGWQPVANTSVQFDLEYAGAVLLSYHMLVTGDKPHHPGGDFINDVQRPESGVRDVVGARLVVDGVAMRQSGSHATPVGALEVASEQLDGHLILNLAAGVHNVTLEWRKWGSFVRSWSNRPSYRDGFVSGRALLVNADFAYLWYTQPMANGTQLSQAGGWYPFAPLSLDFKLARAATMRLQYAFQARPEAIYAADVLNKRDDIGARLVVDGAPFRESGSIYSSKTKTSAELVCSVPQVRRSLPASPAP